ncbi:hypothetical protein ACTXT7_010917 [Hymenolepis weldensis]
MVAFQKGLQLYLFTVHHIVVAVCFTFLLIPRDMFLDLHTTFNAKPVTALVIMTRPAPTLLDLRRDGMIYVESDRSNAFNPIGDDNQYLRH